MLAMAEGSWVKPALRGAVCLFSTTWAMAPAEGLGATALALGASVAGWRLCGWSTSGSFLDCSWRG